MRFSYQNEARFPIQPSLEHGMTPRTRLGECRLWVGLSRSLGSNAIDDLDGPRMASPGGERTFTFAVCGRPSRLISARRIAPSVIMRSRTGGRLGDDARNSPLAARPHFSPQAKRVE